MGALCLEGRGPRTLWGEGPALELESAPASAPELERLAPKLGRAHPGAMPDEPKVAPGAPCNKNLLQKPPREVAREMPPEGGKFLISPELARNAIIEWPDVDLI
jgi:hypothetical protein